MPLHCPVQHYAWGSKTSIPRLLGKDSPQLEPWAEMWMGAHQKAPSLLEGGTSLADFIAKAPAKTLGTEAFGPTLPFLFKILAANAPLSIQCHPNKAQAEAGFAAEQAAGVPLNARNRNYRDRNHKPELIVALEEFWALKGFRDPADIAELFSKAKLHSATPLLELLTGQDGLRNFYASLLGLAPEATRTLLSELERGLDGLPEDEAQWSRKLLSLYPDDQSATSALVLQLVVLQEGEGLFLGAGELHAYLSGTGLEIMANSDNVLRGGLTPKHVDPTELLRVLHFGHPPIEVLRAEGSGPVRHFESPCDEFFLEHLHLDAGASAQYEPSSPRAQIWLCLGAGVQLHWGSGSLALAQGEVAFVTANAPTIVAHAIQSDACDVWIASYGQQTE
ncbi:MAG: mannose-6-phosphate isomerase, class I [Myxococcales bacterium]|nr:mannose-6-phosphate isomerase, class I [Myxococcales bacterium]